MTSGLHSQALPTEKLKPCGGCDAPLEPDMSHVITANGHVFCPQCISQSLCKDEQFVAITEQLQFSGRELFPKHVSRLFSTVGPKVSSLLFVGVAIEGHDVIAGLLFAAFASAVVFALAVLLVAVESFQAMRRATIVSFRQGYVEIVTSPRGRIPMAPSGGLKLPSKWVRWWNTPRPTGTVGRWLNLPLVSHLTLECRPHHLAGCDVPLGLTPEMHMAWQCVLQSSEQVVRTAECSRRPVSFSSVARAYIGWSAACAGIYGWAYILVAVLKALTGRVDIAAGFGAAALILGFVSLIGMMFYCEMRSPWR